MSSYNPRGTDEQPDEYNTPAEPLIPRRSISDSSDSSGRAATRLSFLTRSPALVGGGLVLAVVLVITSIVAAMATLHSSSPSSSTRGLSTPIARATASTPATGSGTTDGLPLPSGIPSHFSFGLMNAPGDVSLMNDMRTRNGAAWDVRYQYLAGGVNTGQGWETWVQPTGQFATDYLQESANSHYIPALVYYDLLQSTGKCDGCPEQERDLANVNNPSVMSAYFANWRLLMQKLGAFNRPALVVVEPDLWGFMELSLAGSSRGPAAIPASVASSRDADALAFPNTAQGFAWALLHIRDRYAPNAVLALHASGWGSGRDINSDTDPALSAAAVANSVAAFLKPLGLSETPHGVSTWDIVTNDVADRDSGQGAAWWDRTNQQFPNFARYLTFAHTLSQATKRWILMWQVPEGNEFFATQNNTQHHTQDNRAEYILGHVSDFARAGIAGVLFGPGNGGTSVDDAAHDGVTNPAPINSFQCDRCNSHLSIYPDDDGGYLRLFVGAYYRHKPLDLAHPDAWTIPAAPDLAIQATVKPPPPGACEGVPVASIGKTDATPNPVSAGSDATVAIHITLSCDTEALVEVEIYGSNVRIQQSVQDHIAFSAGQDKTVSIQVHIPSTIPVGSYPVKIGVVQAGWGILYAWSDNATVLTVQ